ncbi:uncharacterized protein BXZ73DRAFT_106130 [Epithele typhae]|uniref:uncharacterized protein n=1 Tax=Epithele typhae TaxID=378194 RepID=UPI0020083047|nr:uncharacterized protein BXZ73DRAFT_106130 [Epithele typhae]KAH9915581.1 hypothetical protein BXZ73DRAFT_106130 [Epithele typhae]
MTTTRSDNRPSCTVQDNHLERIIETEDGPAMEKMGQASLHTTLEDTRRHINHLPSELLVYIFAACFQLTRPSQEHAERVHRRRKVLLVCRSWRDLIQTTPSLWSFISPHTPRRLYNFLMSRAADASVDLCFKRKGLLSPPLSPDLAPIDLP